MWRDAHGRSARLGRLVASETLKLAEVPAAPPVEAAPPDRDHAGRFVTGNRLGRSKRLRVGSSGAIATLEAQGDSAWRQAMAWGRRYSAHRRTELQALYGALSAGAASLVETEGRLLASSRYWDARSGAEGNPDFARLSAQLSAQARGTARDALEMAHREATARRETRPANALAALLAAPAPSDDEQEAPALEPAQEAP